jgi:hypothetical protein
MSKLATINIIIGFLAILVAACGGFFLALIAGSTIQSNNSQYLNSLVFTLQKSAHTHTNMFGYLHILFALTLRYSKLKLKTKYTQTIGLLLGTFSMSFIMILRANFFTNQANFLEIISAIFLSFSLLSLLTHIYGIFLSLTAVNSP